MSMEVDARWVDLPTAVFAPIVGQLESLEVKTMRLVCPGWRWSIDASLPWLTPRELKAELLVHNFPNILNLDITAAVGPTPEQLHLITKLPLLRSLSIKGNYTTNDASLEILTSLTMLTRLRFADAKALMDDGLGALGSLKALRALSLKGADGISGAGLTSLLKCTDLQALDLCNCSGLNDQGIRVIAQLTALTELLLANCKLDRTGEPTAEAMLANGISEGTRLRRQAMALLLESMNGLRRLNVKNSCCFTNPWLKPYYSHLSSITDLNMGDVTNVSYDAGLEAISRLPTLEHLDLEGLGPFKAGTVSKLSLLTRLHSLNISIAQLQNKHLRAITRIGELRCLHMGKARRVTDEGMAEIGRRLTNLTEVSISRAELSGDGIHSFELLTPLRSLTITECHKISGWALRLLSIHTGLTFLDLSSDPFISNKGLVDLASLSQLHCLSLASCEGVTDEGIVHLSSLDSLQRLDLTYDRVGDLGMEGIGHLRKLTELCIGNTETTDLGIRILTKLVHLRKLALFGTSITDAGLEHMSRLTALQSLNLSFCTRLTDVGVYSFLGPLAHNFSLSEAAFDRVPDVTELAQKRLSSCMVRGVSGRRPDVRPSGAGFVEMSAR